MQNNLPEVWLRGPIEGLSPLLQPVAHALLQALEEIEKSLTNFPDALLWEKPAGAASVGFHLQHNKGVLHRLMTYAKDQQLSADQFVYLNAEGVQDKRLTTAYLVTNLRVQITSFIEELKNWDENTLIEPRAVGRNRLPSTVLGLFFHAAEHTMRHTGQLIVTVSVLTNKRGKDGVL